MDVVLDYSFARPDPAAIKRAGVVGVVRYLGHGAGKLISGPELERLHRAGLAVGFVWETSANRMDVGAGGGASDARQANAQADALGVPTDRPIYFANDQNRFTSAHLDYMRGARDNSRRPVGPYGNSALVDACAHALGCRYGWKVQTWGPPSPNATLEQMPNVRPPVPDTDVNYAHRPDWGGWPTVGGTPAPVPVPVRVPILGEPMTPITFHYDDHQQTAYVDDAGAICKWAFPGDPHASNVKGWTLDRTLADATRGKLAPGSGLAVETSLEHDPAAGDLHLFGVAADGKALVHVTYVKKARHYAVDTLTP